MMARTQISLDTELQRRARERAAQLGVSLAEYIRSLVVRDLGEPQTRAAVTSVFDLGSSGGSDIARDKDELLGRAVAETAPRYGETEDPKAPRADSPPE